MSLQNEHDNLNTEANSTFMSLISFCTGAFSHWSWCLLCLHLNFKHVQIINWFF